MPPAVKFNDAIKHLRRADPVLKRVIAEVGPCRLKVQRNRFHALARSIIAQQISTSAAASIRRRLEELVAPEPISAAALARLSVEEMRTAGVSPQKACYLLDLAARVESGQVRLARIGRLSDEAVIEELTQVKGIGRWTAQMFLIFSLGRPDVFPHDDLGIRSALRTLYELPDLPDRAASHAIAAAWRPYASVASWYCWRSLESK
jgi:DNA-3-methyladenine glycosylase II